MCLLKRIAPFVVTLIVGIMLGGFARSFNSTPRNTFSVSPHLVVGSGYGGCRYRMREAVVARDRTPAVILFKPYAPLTSDARRHQTTGIVRLHASLNADGTITDIAPLNTLPDGLTDEAMRAAQQIKFKPATLYGTPISEERNDITFEFDLG